MYSSIASVGFRVRIRLDLPSDYDDSLPSQDTGYAGCCYVYLRSLGRFLAYVKLTALQANNPLTPILRPYFMNSNS